MCIIVILLLWPLSTDEHSVPPPDCTAFFDLISIKQNVKSFTSSMFTSQKSVHTSFRNDTFLHVACQTSPFTTISTTAPCRDRIFGYSHTYKHLLAASEGSWAERKGWRGHKGQVSVPSFLHSPTFLVEIKPIKQTGAHSVNVVCGCVFVCMFVCTRQHRSCLLRKNH